MPTEKKAIEKLGLDRSKIPVNQFRDTCREFTMNYKDLQTEGFKRLGVLADWEHPYITYQPQMEAKQIEIFAGMYNKGYIYKGLKPVYWCTDCETALAEAEIEYKDVDSDTVYVKFPVSDSKGLFDKKNTFFVIWTTTPWTLPGNSMVAVGPEFTYALVDGGNGERYIFAKDLVEQVMQKAGLENYKILEEYKGQNLEGLSCKHPFLDRESKVVTGSEDTVNVDLETGTGCVHCAPSYGKEDYLLGLKKDGDIIVVVDEKGFQRGEGAGPFDGMYYAKSNKEIKNWLDENGYLLASQVINHSYPHCWRCKKPVIFRATNQWFASVDGFRKETLEAIKTVKWIPEWGETRISKMIEDRNDWCISRQRTWGVPIPAFYCKECGKPYMTEESLKKVQEIFREKGSNAWFDLSEEELMPKGAKCECGSKEFKKETDIMDVWFDSGSTYHSVLEERGLPEADLYLEGSDQYRGWFQSSLLTSVANFGKAPYKQVLTHGYTVDEQGRKMSKSIGNVIAPQEIIKESGADVLRLWVLASDYQSDVSVSKNIIKQVTEVYRKIRNTARYILGNIHDFDVDNPVAYEDLFEIDKWALTRLNKLIRSCTKAYEEYSFHDAYHAINQFCVVDMSQFYLDIIKDRLYTYKRDSVGRRAAQTTMYEILSALVRILAPMTCFTAEEIWSYMPHKKGENTESVMLDYYPKANEKYDDKDLTARWEKIISVKEIVAKKLEELRADKTIGLSLEAKVTLYADGSDYEFLKDKVELLKEVLIVSGVTVEENRRNEDKEVAIGVKIEKADGEKCERCWMYSTTVGENHEYPTLCERCRDNLD
jgi:isoleucyl-tRNA synthetase